MEQITYRVIRSDRRTVAIQIAPNGQVLVRCPRIMRNTQIEHFVQSRSAWIEKHLAMMEQKLPALTPNTLQRLAAQAAKEIPKRVEHFAPKVGVTYGRITIRRQRTRWGSCSAKGNLNFNCLLLLAPPEVLDYVVIHELCHRKEMNHSARFWAEVERICPDHSSCRKWLKENGPGLISRL